MIAQRITISVCVAFLLVLAPACQPRPPRVPAVPPKTNTSWDASSVTPRRADQWSWDEATDVPAGLIDLELVEQLREREAKVHNNPARLFRVIWYGDRSDGHYYIYDSTSRTDTLTAYRVDPSARRVLERLERLPT